MGNPILSHYYNRLLRENFYANVQQQATGISGFIVPQQQAWGMQRPVPALAQYIESANGLIGCEAGKPTKEEMPEYGTVMKRWNMKGGK